VTQPTVQRLRLGAANIGLITGIVLLLIILAWQIHRGATIQRIGIPNVFEIDLGKKPPTFCIHEDLGYDRFGSDYNGGPTMQSLQQCESSCLVDDQCRALSFNQTSRQCWLKTAPGLRQPNPNFTAGVKDRC